jgi:hypothetical protein
VEPRPLRLRTCAGLLCFYGLLAAWWLRPVTWQLRDHVPGTPGSSLIERLGFSEVYTDLWVLTASAQQLWSRPSELFHPPVYYPERYALALSDQMLGHQVLFGPAYGLSGNPVLALNLSSLLSTTLLGIGTHLLLRRWGAGLPAAVLGASLAIYAPWRTGPQVQVHTLWVHNLPFVLLFLDRYLTRRRLRDLALAAACLVLQTWTPFYTAFAAVILAAVYLLGQARRAPRAVSRAALGILVALAVAAAESYPYLALARAGTLRAYPAELMPPFFGLRGAPGVLTWKDLGIVSMALTMLLAIPRRFLPQAPQHAPYGALLAIAAAGYVLALGPALPLPRAPVHALRAIWDILTAHDPGFLERRLTSTGEDVISIPTPYAVLTTIVPGFKQLRTPYRFGVLPATVLPITAALALERIPAPAARSLVALALSVWTLVRAAPMSSAPIEVGPSIPPAYRWLRAHGRGLPLLEAPVGTRLALVAGTYYDCRAMYLATYHRLPLVNGRGGFLPDAVRRRIEIAARFPSPDAVADLCRETKLGWILLHRDRLTPRVRSAWRHRDPSLAVAASFGRDVVFRVRCASR